MTEPTPTPNVDNLVYDVPVNAIREYHANPRVGNVAAIAESLKANGQFRPIVVRRDTQEILAGNHTWKAAKALGWETIRVTYVDNITDDQAKRIVLADNRYGELGGYDNKALTDLLNSLGTLDGTGYDAAYLDVLMAGLVPDAPEALTDPDDVPEVPELPEAFTKPGDVWVLGQHRLICGDGTDPEVYKALTLGKQVDTVITDPPYNVAYEGGVKTKGKDYRSKSRQNHEIQNDDMGEEAFLAFLTKAFERMYEVTKEGGPIYVFHSDVHGQSFRKAFVDAGYMLKQMMVWVKDRLVLSRQDYHWIHEPIIYGWKPGAAHYWEGGRTQTTVIDEKPDFREMKKEDLLQFVLGLYDTTTVIREDRPGQSKEHPTMKPVKLVARLMQNSSPYQGIVLDPFGGSGSTLIAAHGLGRICYTIELDPRYADVIAKRFQEHTGIVPILEATGEPHDFTKPVQKKKA